TGDAHHLVLLVLSGQRATEAGLQQFGLVAQDGAAHLDVVGDDIATEGDHRRVADDVVAEDGDVGGASTDVHEHHTGLLFLSAQYGIGAGQGLEDELGDLQIGTVHALVEVAGGGDLAGDDVEVGLETHAAHADGVLDT